MYKKFYYLLALTLILLIVFAILDKAAINTSTPPEIIETTTKKEEIKPEPDEFGLIDEDYEKKTGKVEHNQFLSDILQKYNIEYQTIDKLVKKCDSVFDIKSIRAGNRYVAYMNDDSVSKTDYFVYEITPISYVIFDFRDTINIIRGEKEVDVRIKKASGVINTSLWVDMTEQGQDPYLAVMLSEVYAWTVDFFGIQKGDCYKVIYEEKYVDDEKVGFGRILAAYFGHYDKDLYAFHFDKENGEYFDENGKSLKRKFLKSPLSYSRISSGFSNSRLHPILKVRRPHHGVDYAAPRGTPVHTVADGTVVYAGYSGGAGRMVKIRHNGTSFLTKYLHLSRFAKGIRSGARVNQGQTIGYVGSTGLSTGPHLDFRVYRSGSPINPLKLDPPPLEPVKAKYKEEYEAHVGKWRAKLDSINIPAV